MTVEDGYPVVGGYDSGRWIPGRGRVWQMGRGM